MHMIREKYFSGQNDRECAPKFSFNREKLVTWNLITMDFSYNRGGTPTGTRLGNFRSIDTRRSNGEGEKMSSLFVKGMLVKSVDESCLPTRLEQRRTGRTGDLCRLNHHRQPPVIPWNCRGDFSATCRIDSRIGGSVPLRAVLNPVSPPVKTTKKVRQ
ncbi:hypothetical protein E3N88_44972 [Mikania micrantha]|uniref:Uncharacterized protein n=1 Tax=Mikania micrantha TaxID=192012 RepID=A0A5N6LAJ7_9ASTR|nr:hypothetical protein E3N88_44972 [Mikania micrantha]